MDPWVYVMGGIIGLLGYFVADLGAKVSKLDRKLAEHLSLDRRYEEVRKEV